MAALKLLMHFFLLQMFLFGCDAKRLHRVRRGWFSNGKPTEVQCAFNPCSVPGFCGTGRTCVMDDNCRHHCECENGSSHEECKEITLSQVATPKPAKCTFNPCASPAFTCDGGRKCVLNDLCMPECACLDGSTHSSCLDETDETTTKHTINVTTKADKCETGGVTCKNGQCVEKGVKYTCICDKGWSGFTCNESKCTMECSEGFYCHFVTPSVQICVEILQEKTTMQTTLSTQTTEISVISNVCNGSYIDHDYQERKCPSGTACKYGICDSDGDSEKCKCDAGSTGTLCEYKCCRDCGNFGTCTIDDERGEICKCHEDYIGVNCTGTSSHLNGCAPDHPGRAQVKLRFMPVLPRSFPGDAGRAPFDPGKAQAEPKTIQAEPR